MLSHQTVKNYGIIYIHNNNDENNRNYRDNENKCLSLELLILLNELSTKKSYLSLLSGSFGVKSVLTDCNGAVYRLPESPRYFIDPYRSHRVQ